MGALSDYLATEQSTPAPAAPPEAESPGQFTKGLRSGLSSAGSSLTALAGNVVEAFDPQSANAKSLYDMSHRLQADAQANAPRVSKIADVGSLRDFYDYATGIVGQSVPVAGAALAGGMVGGLPGAAAAMLPVEAGSMVERQNADADVMARTTPAERLRDAVVTGAGSAALNSVVPAGVAGKIVTRGAAPSLRAGLGGAAETVGLGAGTSAATEGLKQASIASSSGDVANPAKYDPAAIAEAGAAGAVGSLPFAGVGLGADAARAASKTPVNVLQGVKDVAGRAKDAATDAGEKAAQTAKAAAPDVTVADPLDAIKGLAKRGTDAAGDLWNAIKTGEEYAGVRDAAGATIDAIKAKMPSADDARVAKVREVYDRMMGDPETPGPVRDALSKVTDLTDRAQQTIVGTVADAAESAKDRIAKVRDFANKYADEAGLPKLDGPKKSADEGGLRAALRDTVIPVLEEHYPGAFADDKSINETATGIRSMVNRIVAKGEFGGGEIADILETYGKAAEPLMNAVYDAVYKKGSRATDEAFFGAMQRLNEAQKGHGEFVSALDGMLKPEVARRMGGQVDNLAWRLKEWATSSKQEDSAAGRYRNTQIVDEMRKLFGDKTDDALELVQKVSKANEENAIQKERPGEDGTVKPGDTTGMNERGGVTLAEREQSPNYEAHYYGREYKDAEGNVRRDALTKAPQFEKDPTKNQATAALARAQAEHPDKNVSFLSAKELGDTHPSVKAMSERLTKQAMDAHPEWTQEQVSRAVAREMDKHGMVVAEGEKQAGSLNARDIAGLKLVKKEGDSYTNAARIDAPDGTPLDAIALTKKMNASMDYTETDNISTPHRLARAFQEGLAGLMLHYGAKIEPKPDTAIAILGKNGKGEPIYLKYKDIEKLDFRTDKDREVDSARAKVRELHEKYKEAKAQGDDRSADSLRAQVKSMLDEMEFSKARDLIDNDASTAKLFDKDGNITKAGLDALLAERGATDHDPFGNIRTTPVEQVNVNSDGSPRNPSPGPKAGEGMGTGDKIDYPAMRERFNGLKDSGKAPQRAMAERALWVMDHASEMDKGAQKALSKIAGSGGPERKLSDVMTVIDGLHERYAKLRNEEAATGPTPVQKRVLELLDKEDYSTLQTAPQVWRFLREAKAMFDAGVENDRLSAMFDTKARGGALTDLGSFFDDIAHLTDEEVRAKLNAAPEVAAQGPKASKGGVNAAQTASAKTEAAIRSYIDDVLGPSVKTIIEADLSKLPHAGEFERIIDPKTKVADDIIRISAHALSPLTVAFHESLHAFFAKVMDQKNGKVASVLMNAATSEKVQKKLQEYLKNSPEALAQLHDPEEAAAYMYQFWMRGKDVGLSPVPKNIFEKFRSWIEKTLGIWSNDERAEKIMEYFSSGDFKANMNDPNAVAKALLESGHNEYVQKARKLTDPIVNAADKLLVPAGERMRDTAIPALKQLADLAKRERTAEGEDPGFLPASRYKYSLYMNQLASKLEPYSKEQLREALEAMQGGPKAGLSAEAKAIVDMIQGPNGLLPKVMPEYLKKAGVDVSKWQPRPDYFPRMYDIDYIARHEDAFVKVIETHAPGIADPRGLVRRIIANNGQEFTVETNKPGNQYAKERRLAEIPDDALREFMVKDPYRILSSYIMQSTRQAEWTRRFGANGERIEQLLKQAKDQGATKDQLTAADDFVKAVNGTLGDDLNPTARRIMGNINVYQNIRLLPLAAFSNLVDPLGIVVRGGTVKDAFGAWKQAVKEVRNTFRDVYQHDADTRLAEVMGTIDNAVLTHEMASLHTQGMVGETGRKINDWFFRYNLVEGQNRAMRIAATQAAIGFLERHADGTASPHSVRWLAELGLRPGDITGPINETAHPKIKAAINRWVDGAVLRPDAADRALWMSDPHYMLFSHLKQFTFAFHETILKRVMHEAEHGNFAPVMALSSYVPVMIAADFMKSLLQGGGELPDWKKKWGVGDYVASGMERAGLMGRHQFAHDAVKDLTRGEPWMGSVTGPAVDQMFSGLSVVGGKVDGNKWLLDALPAHAAYQSALGD